MPKKSLADEAREFATGIGAEGTRRLAYETAYETVVGRIRKGRYRGLCDEWERDFLDGVAATARHRLSELAAEREAKQDALRKAS